MSMYDLSHPVLFSSKVGHSACLFARPIGPGESISFTPDYHLQGAQLKQPSPIPAMYKAFAVYVPARWIYGKTHMEAFVRQGKAETVTFEGDALGSGHVYNSLGAIAETGTLPKWRRYGPFLAHKWFQRYPKDESLLTFDHYKTRFWEHASLGEAYRLYGLPYAYGEHIALDGLWSELTAAGLEVDIDTTNNNVDMLDIVKQQNERVREFQRLSGEEFFDDVYKQRFGTDISKEVEQRPIMIMEPDYGSLSGMSVEPTDQEGVGRQTGRWSAHVNKGFTYRAEEHGYVFYFLGVTIEWINPDLRHLFHYKVDPTYKEFGFDPLFLREDEIREYTESDYYGGNSTTVISVQPEHQHYRWHPPLIDTRFDQRGVYAFNDRRLRLADRNYFYQPGEYDHIFASTVLRDYHLVGRNVVQYMSNVPEGVVNPGTSL